MLYSLISAVLAGATFAAASPARVPAQVDARAVQPVEVNSVRDAAALEKRMSAEFDLVHEWDHELLFGASHGELGFFDDIAYADSVGLSVMCVECWTKGVVTAELTTEDIFKPVVRLAFAGVEAYLDIAVAAHAGATYAITLFATESPLGLSLPDLDIGLVFSLDLVFSVSATVELEGGFYVKLADDAYLDTDLFSGDIADSFFDGIRTQSIPVTVHSGSAVFKADLRLRVQGGAESELDILGIGAGAEIGIYANLLEFGAELDSTASCGLETREWFDINVGAFARLDVEVDYKTFAAVPTVSTTLFDSPTYTQCAIGGSPSGSGSGTAVYASITASESASASASYSYGASLSSGASTGATPVSTPTYPASQGSTYTRGSFTPSSGYSNSSVTATSSGGLVTSTIYSTTEYTVTSCAASVVNCPASLGSEIVITRTVDAYTTVCPYGASITAPPATTESAGPQGSEVTAVATITKLIVIPKVSPQVETFVASSTAAQSAQQQLTTSVSLMPVPTTVAVVPANKAEKVNTYYEYQNGTSTMTQAISSYGTSVGTGSMTMATASATMPVQAAGNSVEASRLGGIVVACAVLAGVAGLM